MPKVKRTWKGFKAKHKDCKACDLCNHRNRIVLAKGKIPCDILFVGEAPGASEDVLGQPFVGPAGKLMHKLIDDAQEQARVNARLAFTNLVCCIPKDEEKTKVHAPNKTQIQACYNRLSEFVELCKPQVMVAVGSIAEKNLTTLFVEHDVRGIAHPAGILRADISQRQLSCQRCVATLVDVFESLCPF